MPMIWTWIFKNHYFSISDKSKHKWIVALFGTFADILSSEKTKNFTSI
jgi:hypothetical protein